MLMKNHDTKAYETYWIHSLFCKPLIERLSLQALATEGESLNLVIQQVPTRWC